MAQKRRFTAEKKIEILREYFGYPPLRGENDVPISDLCEQYQLSPTMIYTWKKQLFEGALQTFSPSHKGKSSAERKIKELTQTLQDRDSVIPQRRDYYRECPFIPKAPLSGKKSLNGKI